MNFDPQKARRFKPFTQPNPKGALKNARSARRLFVLRLMGFERLEALAALRKAGW
jgi:hypothetical protein